MTHFVFACLLSLLAVPAFAQEPTKRGAFQAQTPDWYSTSLVINAGIIRLGPNGCLRGPLKFLDDDGKVSFSLDDGAHYPAGCGGQ